MILAYSLGQTTGSILRLLQITSAIGFLLFSSSKVWTRRLGVLW